MNTEAGKKVNARTLFSFSIFFHLVFASLSL